MSADGISTRKDSKGTISILFRFNKKGTASVKGDFGIEPVMADLNINLKDIAIKSFKPYLADHVNIIITDGKLSANSGLSLKMDAGKRTSARVRGTLSLSDFASLDPVNADTFLAWGELKFHEIDAGYNPVYLKINEISLRDFYNHMVIDPNGSLNLNAVIASGSNDNSMEESPPAADKQSPIDQIEIAKVAFKGGKLDFIDLKISPNYSANLYDMEGYVEGLFLTGNEQANLEFKAKIDHQTPLSITGKVRPLKNNLFAGLKIDTSNIELSPMTPYFGKYIGYAVQKGKLSLDLQYLIDGRKLDAKNQIFLDQFTLGDTVESPDAARLPIKLAIALLKNRAGEIRLDLPVTGDLDDPEFSISKIVFKAIFNMIAKAATSPFALLGGLISGGEELRYVEFGSGMFTINEEASKRLDIIAKALYERPALKLEIRGFTSPEQDREALRQYMFNNKLKVEKAKDLAKKKDTAIPVNDIVIEPDEYEKYLENAYKSASFEKPKNFIGLNKDIPAVEMESLIYANIQITDNDLRLLAVNRAAEVKKYLIETGQVEPERIFIIEPDAPIDKEKKAAPIDRANKKAPHDMDEETASLDRDEETVRPGCRADIIIQY